MAVLVKAPTEKTKSELPADLSQAISDETHFINGVLKIADEKKSAYFFNMARKHILRKLELIDARLAELKTKKKGFGKGLLRDIHKHISIPLIKRTEEALADDRKKTEELLKRVNEKIASAQKAEGEQERTFWQQEPAEKEEIPLRIKGRMEREV